MPGFEGGLGGAATGAAIGSFLMPGVGTAVGAGLGGLFGFFGGRKKQGESEKLMLERFREMQDPNYLRGEFMQTARQLAPSQSDILGRLRAGGVGLGQASALANRQFSSDQSRARQAGANAFSQFQMGNQGNINSLLSGIASQENFRRSEETSFNNQLLSGGLGLAGMQMGSGGFGMPGAAAQGGQIQGLTGAYNYSPVANPYGF